MILPPMIEDDNACANCYSNKLCSMYAISLENIEGK